MATGAIKSKTSELEEMQIQSFWNDEDEYFTNDQYNNLLMEQYKIYVEMADRASFRRTMINVFFLVVNILVVSLMALGLSRTTSELSMILMALPFLGLLSICYAWWRLVRHYRHSVTIKEKVIGELEKRLPSSPIYLAERDAVNRRGTQNPLKRLEMYMPFIFLSIYIAIYLYLCFNPPWHH